jgi:RNA recognition motif-containing protein
MKLRTTLSLIAAIAAYSPSLAFQTTPRSPLRTRTALSYNTWDAFEMPDNLELMMGATRYEMVELPDSMMSTTLWIGNLCEFVTDEMLGEIFQQASSLKSVPACVARRPNMESLRYGFVSFRSEEEKENAIKLLQGYELNGKCIKVEPIRDHEKYGRIRVPGKIIEYVVGPKKRMRNGEVNTMRRATSTLPTEPTENEGWKMDRDRRKMRMAKRKNRGRYKNQQRKHSRARMTPS